MMQIKNVYNAMVNWITNGVHYAIALAVHLASYVLVNHNALSISIPVHLAVVSVHGSSRTA